MERRRSSAPQVTGCCSPSMDRAPPVFPKCRGSVLPSRLLQMRPGLSPVAVVHLPQDCPLLLSDPSNLHSCFTLNCLSCLPLVSAFFPNSLCFFFFSMCRKVISYTRRIHKFCSHQKLERLRSSKNLPRGPGSSALTGGDQTTLYEKVIEENKPCAV